MVWVYSSVDFILSSPGVSDGFPFLHHKPFWGLFMKVASNPVDAQRLNRCGI